MVAMPLISLVMSPIQAASIILPILIVQDAVSVWAYRREWDRLNMAILLPGAIVGVVFGYLFAAQVSDAAVALAVGIISLVFGVRRLIAEGLSVRPTQTKANIPLGLFWGAIAGFASMIANAGAPPFQVYIIPQKLKRDVFVGTGVLFFATVNWVKVPFFAALGQFNQGNMMTSLALFPLAIASTWAGVILVRRVPAERFYTLFYLLLVVVGSKLIWDGSAAFM
jgi:uncharacterized membrane protein YfcA